MTTGERIKYYRKQAHLTQDELAQKIGTTKQNIYKYEKGVVDNIPLSRISAIASAADASPSEILGLANKESKPADPVEDISPDVLAMARLIMSLPPELRQRIAGYIDSLLANH